MMYRKCGEPVCIQMVQPRKIIDLILTCPLPEIPLISKQPITPKQVSILGDIIEALELGQTWRNCTI